MEKDGVDAEIIFGILGVASRVEDHEAANEMLRIYNDWLKDFCSHYPDRHIGLAWLPYGDIDAMGHLNNVAYLRYLEWARQKYWLAMRGSTDFLDIDFVVAGAEIDVWHSSPEGLYENQDPGQAEMNLRGRFVSDATGRFHFRSVKPAGYPIPIDGPVGELVKATRRHNFRPAHLHFMVYKPGFKTLITQIYAPDDAHIDSDVQFGVTRALIGNYLRHDEPAPEPDVATPWYSLDQRFVLEPGEARRPTAPIRAKASA